MRVHLNYTHVCNILLFPVFITIAGLMHTYIRIYYINKGVQEKNA